MLVCVGSTNPVKVAAARRIFTELFPGAEVTAIAVPSGVPDQPVGDDETVQGAINRAKAALASASSDFGVGLEGGVAQQGDSYWLNQYCAIAHRDGRVTIGIGPRFLLPPAVGRAMCEGHEGGPLFDQIAGVTNIKQKGGAIGFLTHGLVVREDVYTQMVAGALVSFIHPTLYASEAR